MINKVKEISIEYGASIFDALKKMDTTKRKLLIVTEKGFFKSLISIGDIQRAIINNVPLNNPLKGILRMDIKVASSTDDLDQVKEVMKLRRNEFMPVIDQENRIVNIILWGELFGKENQKEKRALKLPVIIMAGGEGTRLRPLTNVLPKPLIPIGEQTIIEDIMDRFVACGCHDFYLSVNYKAELIKRYLDNIDKPQYNISYFQETVPSGTAGSLNLLKDVIESTFFVSNCDIIIDEDYAEILDYHHKNHNEITIVAAIKNYQIPYGTLETGKEGLLQQINEKPEYIFKINTGMYILEPHLIKEIPQHEFYHITYLIEKLCVEKRKVGVYPINEGAWTDIGNWEEYLYRIKSIHS